MMEWTKDDLQKVETKRGKVISIENYDDYTNNGGWYKIKFDNGDVGVAKITAKSKIHLVGNSEWVEYNNIILENGHSFIEIIKGETNTF